MAEIIYGLCTLTALGCAVLLVRGYRRTKYQLLLWSGLCFLGLSVNNLLLVIDEVLFPAVDALLFWRLLTALTGMLLLLYGLIWESQ